MKKLDSIPSDIQELIAAYLLGAVDGNEVQPLIAWIHLSEENKHIFNQLIDIWQATATEKKFEKTDVQKRWKEVLARIQKKQPQANLRIYTPRFYGPIKRIFGIAAAVAIIFGAGMLVQKIQSVPIEKPVSGIAEYIEITAPMGSRTYVALADGSRIWLNAGTKLQYSSQFGKHDRNIKLTGEAYFSVAKRADLPFVIQAADIKITALGTSFNVKAYADEGHVETSLESGSVKIERVKEKDDRKVTDLQPIIVQANEKVLLQAYTSEQSDKDIKKEAKPVMQETTRISPTSITETVVEKIEDIRVSTSWKDNNWVIRDESMKSLAVKLGRRYDVNFVFRDKELEKYKFSTTLRDETLEQVLNMIQISAPIKYLVKEKNVYLSLNPKFKKTFEESIQ